MWLIYLNILQMHVFSISMLCMTLLSREDGFTTVVIEGSVPVGRQKASGQAVTNTDSVLTESRGRDPELAFCRVK